MVLSTLGSSLQIWQLSCFNCSAAVVVAALFFCVCVFFEAFSVFGIVCLSLACGFPSFLLFPYQVDASLDAEDAAKNVLPINRPSANIFKDMSC